MSSFMLLDDDAEGDDEEDAAPEAPEMVPEKEAGSKRNDPGKQNLESFVHQLCRPQLVSYVVSSSSGADTDHKFTHGLERPTFHRDTSVATFQGRFSIFYGKCFICGIPGHSCRHCPLKFCKKCNSYGHSAMYCRNPIKRRRKRRSPPSYNAKN